MIKISDRTLRFPLHLCSERKDYERRYKEGCVFAARIPGHGVGGAGGCWDVIGDGGGGPGAASVSGEKRSKRQCPRPEQSRDRWPKSGFFLAAAHRRRRRTDFQIPFRTRS